MMWMRCKPAALLVFLLCGYYGTEIAAAQTKVVIAPTFSALYPFDGEQTSRIQCYQFISGRAGDVVSLYMRSSRNTDLRFGLLEGNWPSVCEGGQPSFQLPGQPFTLPRDGPLALVISSSNWMPFTENRIQGIVQISRTNTPADLAALKDLLGGFASYVDARFLTPSFTITYKPCGMINASTDPATGDITLCSELFNSQITPRLEFAIFLHELGHSLLSKWGERGSDRESVADDFAAALLIKEDDGVGGVQDFAKWLAENQNPWIEQFQEIAAGDPHPPNIQRANLLLGSLYGNIKQFEEGWNRTLYPHMRSDWLQKVPNGNYESPDLANAVLRRRITELGTTSQSWPAR